MTADATDPRAYEWPRVGLEGGCERPVAPPEGEDTAATIQAATEALRFCGPDRCLNVVPCGELCWVVTA